MSVRHFINLGEFDAQTLKDILKNAHALKAQKYNPPQLFKGLSLAMMFDKRSTRTRMSFEIAMKQLGGHSMILNKDDIQLGGSESLESTARVMSRFVDAIMLRLSNHDMMEQLAKHADIPVINGMTDISHPCQIMADMMTIEEKLGGLEGKKIAWFGDYNNVTQSFVDASTKFDFEFVAALPEDLHGNADKGCTITADATAAASNADVIVTDTWVSMGQEGKTLDKFWPYQVNADLMAQANDNAIFMHCMPIHEWEEVTEEVAKSPESVIFDEAENRLHAQKAILAWCLEEAGVEV
ncbi:MAG: ornithine carbamoyltransferase [Alphaproteobacteria bacterium]|nr:ornithine carbamoyltransferase [Alphaproteobacteria bacterium]